MIIVHYSDRLIYLSSFSFNPKTNFIGDFLMNLFPDRLSNRVVLGIQLGMEQHRCQGNEVVQERSYRKSNLKQINFTISIVSSILYLFFTNLLCLDCDGRCHSSRTIN